MGRASRVGTIIGSALLAWGSLAPAFAINGGEPAGPSVGEKTVLLYKLDYDGSRKFGWCSAVLIDQDLLLTAAHCVNPLFRYLVEVNVANSKQYWPIVRMARHPEYKPMLSSLRTFGPSPGAFRQDQANPDLAILKVIRRLPESYRPATLSASPQRGGTFTVAGFGLTADQDLRTGLTAERDWKHLLRQIDFSFMRVIGKDWVHLFEAETSSGSSCGGDSGGPVLKGDNLLAIIHGASGLQTNNRCGSGTIATLVEPHRDWIEQIARYFGNSEIHFASSELGIPNYAFVGTSQPSTEYPPPGSFLDSTQPATTFAPPHIAEKETKSAGEITDRVNRQVPYASSEPKTVPAPKKVQTLRFEPGIGLVKNSQVDAPILLPPPVQSPLAETPPPTADHSQEQIDKIPMTYRFDWPLRTQLEAFKPRSDWNAADYRALGQLARKLNAVCDPDYDTIGANMFYAVVRSGCAPGPSVIAVHDRDN